MGFPRRLRFLWRIRRLAPKPERGQMIAYVDVTSSVGPSAFCLFRRCVPGTSKVNLAILHAAAAFWNTRRLTRRLKIREDVVRWRAARLDHFLSSKVSQAQFYAGLGAAKLEDLPIVDKATVLASFARMNIAGVTLDEARAALAAGEERVRG